jgi:hypothetical protein
VTQKFSKCSYPDCEGSYNPTRSGNIPLCVRHLEMMKFFLWMLDNVRMKNSEKEEVARKSGLVLP